MNRTFLFLILLLISSSWAVAKESAFTVAPGLEVEVRLIKNPDEDAKLMIYHEGKLRQTFPGMGGGFRKLGFEGKAVRFAGLDLNKDGRKELVVRTSQEPMLVGSLWVFEWDSSEMAFRMLRPAPNGDDYLPIPFEGLVHLKENGQLTYSMVDGKTTVTYLWTGKSFTLR